MVSENSDNLLTFISNLSGVDYKRVEEDFGGGYVRLDVAEAERRQAKHDIRTVEGVVTEFLRNSRDAGATKIFIAFYKKDAIERHIVGIDDGCGIPSSMQKKIFESRVTSKLDSVTFDDFGIHGRGMALYSIKSIVKAVRIVHSQVGRGSIFKAIVDTSKLPERKDQSSFPTMSVWKGNLLIKKGPHNVPRLLGELSLSYPQIEIFFGSPAQILATMYNLASTTIEAASQRKELDCFRYPNSKLWQCISSISDGAALSKMAKKYYGLDISERNGRRILDGAVKPLLAVVSSNERQKFVDQGCINTPNREANLTKYIPQQELEYLSKVIQENIREIEQKYFVKIQGEPKVSKFRNQISITFRLTRDGY